jgi:CRISPR-associated protein Csa2
MSGFVSVSLRWLVNVESLNGIESIGNLSRHRTAPIVVRDGDSYEIKFVPCISGESLAHAYQSLVIEHAQKKGLPIGEYSKLNEFVKFTDENIMKKEKVKPPQNADDVRRAEVDVMLKDTICDIGGFLYAGGFPIKRTSRFQVGYMIPASEDIRASALEAQFHVRHSPSSLKKGKEFQIPYNIEVGSAVYTFTFNLDVEGVSRPSTLYGKKVPNEKKLDSQRPERVRAALFAMTDLIANPTYGAKRARFLPNSEPLSAVASFSPTSTFTVSPGNSRNFIKETLTRSSDYKSAMSKLGVESEIFMASFDKEGGKETANIQTVGSMESLASTLIAKVLESEE